MEITCPNCSSRFNLPDNVAKVGAKLRCSVCKTVFALDQNNMSPFVAKEPSSLSFGDKISSSGSKKKIFIIAAVVLVLLAFGAGGAFWYTKNKAEVAAKNAEPGISLEQKVEKLTLRNLRQYYINNEKVGQLFVIEGRVFNGFATVKEFFQVEGAIYGENKKPLASKTVYAGTALSFFQLQVLGEKELEAFLTNKIEILTNNTNIQPGTDVPFMVVFYNPPQGIVEFGVKITDVRDPKAEK